MSLRSTLLSGMAIQGVLWFSADDSAISDAGLIGVYGSARNGNGDKLFNSIHSTLSSLAGNINDQHVARGKVLHSLLFSNVIRELTSAARTGQCQSCHLGR